MSLFKDIVNESLLNEIHQDREKDIKDAINNVLRVRMGYSDGKGGKGKKERYILPVAFGLTKNGKKAVRAYQTMGSSKRGLTNPPNRRKYPKWKLFLLDNIYSWSNGHRSFKDYKDALISMGLNTHGDKGMTTLYAITPFADDDVQVAKTTNPIDAKPITKNDVEPTANSQNKATSDKQDFEPAVVSRGNAIDKQANKSYPNNKIEAPETAPITKAEIAPEVAPTKQDAEDMSKMTAKDAEPVKKSDIENGEDREKIKNDFNDMVNRMNNLYNDNEEENED